jgi:hypothetical protein
MKRSPDERTSKIDPAHVESAGNPPHDKNELRRRLLKMILKSEAARRSRAIGGRPPVIRAPDVSTEIHSDLTIYDPDALLEKEFVADRGPPKRA